MITITTDGDMTTITLDRPDVINAQTPHMWRELVKAAENLPQSTSIVVLRGAGRGFSAGLDRTLLTPQGGDESLFSLLGKSDAGIDLFITEAQRAFTVWREIPAITIAAVHGPAIGAGFQLALACDLLFATPDAVFSCREVTLGLVPDLSGSSTMVAAMGYSKALLLASTGMDVTAQDGFDLGFVTAVTPDLDDAISAYATAIRANPPGASTAVKALLVQATRHDAAAQLAAERAAQITRLRTWGHS